MFWGLYLFSELVGQFGMGYNEGIRCMPRGKVLNKRVSRCYMTAMIIVPLKLYLHDAYYVRRSSVTLMSALPYSGY